MPSFRTPGARARTRRAAASAESLESRTLLAADLVGASFNVTPDAIGGPVPSVTITYTVRNLNTNILFDNAGAFNVNFFLSDNATIDPSGDRLVGTDDFPNGLGAGQSATRTVTLQVGTGLFKFPDADPFVTDNQYFIGLSINATDANSANNQNRGQGLDRDDVLSEHDLPAPADGTNVTERPLTIGTTARGSLSDEWIRSDEDIYAFDAVAGESVSFDLDRDASATGQDAYLRLYDSLFRLQQEDDNTPGPGEPAGREPFISHQFGVSGRFLLVVSGAADRNTNPRRLTGRVATDAGGYSIVTTVLPAPPSAPAMLNTSDTGESASDDITADTTPAFIVVGQPGGTARLFANGTLVDTDATSTSQGVYLMTASPALADGTYDFTATVTDAAGNQSVRSPATRVVIDTHAAGVSKPALAAASDSGRSNSDGITFDNTPTFGGTVNEANEATVSLLQDGVVVQRTRVNPDGTFGFFLFQGLADGVYHFTATSVDLAGNVSPAGPEQVVTIDTVDPPTPPAPDMLASSDSGTSDNDDLTNDTTPALTGTGEPLAQLTLLVDGEIVNKALLTAAVWSFPTPRLAEGAHAVSVELMDVAGNQSQRSPALNVTIDTTPPRPSPFAPFLPPESDSGFSDSDRLTNNTTPFVLVPTLDAPVTWNAFVDRALNASGFAAAAGNFALRLSNLTDGDHSLLFRPFDLAGNLGPFTDPLTITIDTVGPRVLGAPLINTGNGPTSLRYDLNDDIPAGVAADALALTDLTRGQSVPAANVHVDFDPAARRALFTFPGFPGGRLPAGRYEAVLRPEAVLDRAGNGLSEPSRVEFTVPEAPAAVVVGRSVFYNHSGFDGGDAAPGPADDGALATDKRALLPGAGAPTFASVTSFDRGLNGVMIDVAGLPQTVDVDAGPALTAADFDFGAARPPASIAVRRGAGTGGSDRVTLAWTDFSPAGTSPTMAVANGWLTVTMKADVRTALAQPDVFSFGNLIAETGDGTGANGFRVSALDLAAVKRALNTTSSLATTTDFNRDGRTNALDLAIVKRNLNHALPLPPALAGTQTQTILTRATALLTDDASSLPR